MYNESAALPPSRDRRNANVIMASMLGNELILVTGATGYIGGRLVPRLLDAGYRVRCLVRDPARVEGRPWSGRVELATGDALDPESLQAPFRDVSAAYYLIHGMQGGKSNAERDLRAARNLAAAAESASVQKMIYLGELVDPTANLSPYLRSRHETGYLLRQSPVPVTEFRAGMIVGSGSALFEMIRYLAEREPVLVCPAWFFSLAQPIGIRDVLEYLIAALKTPESSGKLVEIGGPDAADVCGYAAGLCKTARVEAGADPNSGQCAAALGLLGAHGHADPLAHRAAAD